MSDRTASIAEILLTAAGLRPDPDELDALTEAYRRRLDLRALYEIAEIKYVDPAIIYLAAYQAGDWPSKQ